MFIQKKLTQTVLLASGCFSACLLVIMPAQAQVTSDGTVSTRVETTDEQNFTVTGGARAGNNLFHSFKTFSVPNGGSVFFANTSNIQNIFSRVTGASASDINGLIGTNSTANLFLINPNGIIFGTNARLDIGGSFLATTAESIHFPDSKFSAITTQTKPLLSVKVPIGLQFGARLGEIVSRSIEVDSQGNPIGGLSVDLGETLAFVGGGILIESSVLLLNGGNMELGSVGSFSFVDLIPNNQGWTFGYEQVPEFQNIQLSQAIVVTSNFAENLPSGNIQLRGQAITITNKSQLVDFDLTANPGGNISIKGSEFIAISDNSILNTSTFSTGKSGNIALQTKRLIVSSGSFVSTAAEDGGGNGGNIIVDASESLEIDGKGLLTRLTASTEPGGGEGGNVDITTTELILRNGGQISSSTRGEGLGGTLTVNVTESIEISGRSEGVNQEPSGLLAETKKLTATTATGDGGNLIVNTKRLDVRDGGTISVAAVDGSQGQAGNLIINAQDITLERAILNAETMVGERGNITISNADTLLLRNNSAITTNALEEATGGNITINSEGIVLIDQSNITANAVEGRGGDINITTQRLFQEPDSQITATSERNIDGKIIINSPDVDPTSGLIELPSVPIDAATILAQDLCKFEDDKIAKGSSFIITGRGGLTPTSADPLDNLDTVVRWANRDDLKVSKDGLVGVRQRSANETIDQSERVIQQAQGWVITSDGSVWLTVDNSQVTLPNSGLLHPDCGLNSNMN